MPLSFTWEIYGDAAAHFNDCFRMFNPTDPARYEEVSRLCWHICIVCACTGAQEWPEAWMYPVGGADMSFVGGPCELSHV